MGAKRNPREAMPSAAASEIQSKLVTAIRTIAELEEKIEKIDKGSKELKADVERRARQTFYLERNLETREREIADIQRQMFTLHAKADAEEFSSLRDDQDSNLERGQRKKEMLNEELAEKKNREKQCYDLAKKYAGELTKASSSSQEIISMFMEEFDKAAKEHAQQKNELIATQGNLVDESSVFDMQKKHVRYLEQYRTDSIFRIFGLKAHLKVLEEKIESQQGINKLASSIGC